MEREDLRIEGLPAPLEDSIGAQYDEFLAFSRPPRWNLAVTTGRVVSTAPDGVEEAAAFPRAGDAAQKIRGLLDESFRRWEERAHPSRPSPPLLAIRLLFDFGLPVFLIWLGSAEFFSQGAGGWHRTGSVLLVSAGIRYLVDAIRCARR